MGVHNLYVSPRFPVQSLFNRTVYLNLRNSLQIRLLDFPNGQGRLLRKHSALETASSGGWTFTNERIRVRSAHAYVSGNDDNPHGTGTSKNDVETGSDH
jgi:hypothetical protein